MEVSRRPMPIRKTATSILPSADIATKAKPSIKASDEDSVCSSKSDKSRIDFHDKQAARAANPFAGTGVVGEE